jgi:aromatic ring-cleaving dioxygenase
MLSSENLAVFVHPNTARPRDDHLRMRSGWGESCR